MEAELPATPSQFSLSIALFILFQGSVPLFWSAISEVKGRKASHLELVMCLLNQMFDELVCVYRIALLIHHWDNCRGFEPQHSTVSQATVAPVLLCIYEISRVIGFRCLQGAG